MKRDPVRRECTGGCGRARYTYRDEWLCRFCLLESRAGESFRSTRRRLSGRCAVCGGPWPDGTGCEHCPKALS